ncbi:MAG: LysR family transcriptional regulator [Ponticaulis sp.]|nr:LysR family transcriptional regulator [Ponticaulis sp.]|tara:strand:- start:33145 stop:34056 length:912 start_codon:yes stop_codon:yes gene_type:complete
MRPTLKQLSYFVEIAETGRFGEAARRMNVSQSSLSAQIADMEEELGARLIERGRHGALLTPAGNDVVVQARLILREVEELKSIARQSEEQFAGRINLGVLPSIGPYLLPPFTRHLHQRFPKLRLVVREESTIDLEKHLSDGHFDLVVSTPEDHPDAESVILFQEHFWVCAAPDDPLSSSLEPVQLSELRHQPFISLGYGHRLSQMVRELAQETGTYVSSEYEGTSLDAVRQMAVMGAGIAVLPSLYALSEARRDPHLTIRRIDHSKAVRNVSLCWRRTSALSTQFRLLADFLSETANDILDAG